MLVQRSLQGQALAGSGASSPAHSPGRLGAWRGEPTCPPPQEPDGDDRGGGGGDGEAEAVAACPRRFVQLAIYSSGAFLCALDWNLFSPVYALTQARFGVSLRAVNSLSNAWNVFAAPGGLAALWVMEARGLRGSLLAGFATQLLCALMGHAACVLPWPRDAAFRLLYASQAVGALGQPLVLNQVTSTMLLHGGRCC